MVAVHVQDDLRRVLDEDGRVIKGAQVPVIPEEDLMRIFDTMLLVRTMDDRMMKIQRQGRLGFYMKSIGEEASHFAVYPLRKTDWVFPSYREQGSWFWAGYTIENYIDQLFGNLNDTTKGRQMPVHHSASWLNYVSISSPVGTQIPQAVGTGMAMSISKTDGVALTFFGEGTSSTGEFHVGMNFAGVTKAPVVFVCRNNGWAISVPMEKQTAAKTFASKAVGYGMPGVRVDGNDILAVIQAAQEAVDRARAGDGPTMIEALTYRREGHSSSDDPSVYRDPDEPVSWDKKDPLNRLRGYLKHKGLYSPEHEKERAAQYNEEITAALARADEAGLPPLESLFEDVYEDPTWPLREQREYLLAQQRTKSPHKH
ncbi:MAG TPA: thiamine pyrophosphate-dependent enzyme [Kofleriaceae bacterium]|nr:thiamine pyrophosphate-dependent enzyme [Kofleriaceae bacterium]